jgi:hypothetical protein
VLLDLTREAYRPVDLCQNDLIKFVPSSDDPTSYSHPESYFEVNFRKLTEDHTINSGEQYYRLLDAQYRTQKLVLSALFNDNKSRKDRLFIPKKIWIKIGSEMINSNGHFDRFLDYYPDINDQTLLLFLNTMNNTKKKFYYNCREFFLQDKSELTQSESSKENNNNKLLQKNNNFTQRKPLKSIRVVDHQMIIQQLLTANNQNHLLLLISLLERIQPFHKHLHPYYILQLYCNIFGGLCSPATPLSRQNPHLTQCKTVAYQLFHNSYLLQQFYQYHKILNASASASENSFHQMRFVTFLLRTMQSLGFEHVLPNFISILFDEKTEFVKLLNENRPQVLSNHPSINEKEFVELIIRDMVMRVNDVKTLNSFIVLTQLYDQVIPRSLVNERLLAWETNPMEFLNLTKKTNAAFIDEINRLIGVQNDPPR